MTKKQPLISVVIAVLNGQATLQKCLESIANQSYPMLEIICIDDGSTDNTLSIFKGWQESHSVIPMTIIQNKKNMGLAKSLNKGIQAANGAYIARIDADDTWHPEKITKQVDFLMTHPDCGVIGSFYTNQRKDQLKKVRLPISNSEIKKTIFRRNPFGHSCVLIKKVLLDTVGGYQAALREDRDLWFRLLYQTNFHNLPEFLVSRDTSKSHFYSPKELRRNIRTVHTYIQKYNASPLTYIWLLEPVTVYIYHAIKKHVRI